MPKWKALVAVALGVGISAALVTLRAQKPGPNVPSLTALDYIQIQQLVAHYSYALDTGADNGYLYADLFAPDGVMHSRLPGEAQKSDYKGRENLARLARINPNPSGGGTRGPLKVSHFLTNHVIYPSPEGATGKEYLVIIDLAEDGKPGTVRQGGHYEDVYVKTPQGWRFKRREMIQSRSGPVPAQSEPRR